MHGGINQAISSGGPRRAHAHHQVRGNRNWCSGLHQEIPSTRFVWRIYVDCYVHHPCCMYIIQSVVYCILAFCRHVSRAHTSDVTSQVSPKINGLILSLLMFDCAKEFRSCLVALCKIFESASFYI